MHGRGSFPDPGPLAVVSLPGLLGPQRAHAVAFAMHGLSTVAALAEPASEPVAALAEPAVAALAEPASEAAAESPAEPVAFDQAAEPASEQVDPLALALGQRTCLGCSALLEIFDSKMPKKSAKSFHSVLSRSISNFFFLPKLFY
jgi:hypothetical protein